MRTSRRNIVSAVLVVVLSTTAACGSSGGEASTAAPSSAGTAASDVLGQVEGLDMPARTAKLTELAKQAGTKRLVFYTSCSDCENLFKAFTAKTGIEVTPYVADANDIMSRIDAGAKAGKLDADIVMITAFSMVQLHQEKLLADFTTPVSKELIPDLVFPYYIGMTLNMSSGCWNTRALPNGPGATWEDVLKNPGKSKLVFEVRQVEWFEGVVAWLVKERGYTEESAIQLFRDAAKGAGKVNGGSLLSGNIASGLYQSALPGDRDLCRRETDKGAPVGYGPMVNPSIGRALGPGILSTSKNGAASLLAIDYMLSKETESAYCIETGRTASQLQAPEQCKMPNETQLTMSDSDIFTDPAQTKHWTDLYAEVLGQ